jgi:hypothetical protein
MSETCLVEQDNALNWREDIEALAFRPDDHGGFCMVHRLAFRTLLRFCPQPAACEAFFRANQQAFQAAARAKIDRDEVEHAVNFHLTSREVSRQIAV